MSGEARRGVELNEPSRRDRKTRELREHLINASNELYLFEMKCEGAGRPVPGVLKRAHVSLRAELRRMETELAIER